MLKYFFSFFNLSSIQKIAFIIQKFEDFQIADLGISQEGT